MEASAAALPAADRHRLSPLHFERRDRLVGDRFRGDRLCGGLLSAVVATVGSFAVLDSGCRSASLRLRRSAVARRPGQARPRRWCRPGLPPWPASVFPNRLDNRLLDDRRLDHRRHCGLGSRDDGDTSRRRSWRRRPGCFFRRRWRDGSQRSAGRGRLWLGGRDLVGASVGNGATATAAIVPGSAAICRHDRAHSAR